MSGLVQFDVITGDIVFMHYSVHEFFDTPPGKGFLLGEEFLACKCLNYLLESGHSVTTIKELKDCLNDLPFYSYAATFWGRHCSHLGDPRPNITALCRKLLIEESSLTRALAHLVCQPQVDDFASENRLFKSSALHLVCHCGIVWVIPAVVDKLAEEITFLEDKSQSPSRYPDTEELHLPKDEWGRTPLHLAAEAGFPKCIKQLQEHTRNLLDPLEKDQFYKTTYHYAVMSNNTAALKALGVPIRSAFDRDKSGRYPLEYAASRGNVQSTQTLLAMSPSEDALQSALGAALENSKTEVSFMLLKIFDQYRIKPNEAHLLTAVKGGFMTAV